jgi:hypothetical protein
MTIINHACEKKGNPIIAYRAEHCRILSFFFYSFECNEPKHVHVQREKMVCKFWLEPTALSRNYGFSPRELNSIRQLIVSNIPKIKETRDEHCG